MPERPSCIIPAAARHRFGSPARRQTGWFCDVDGTVPEKESFARRGRKSLIVHGVVLLRALAVPVFSEAHADKDSFITTWTTTIPGEPIHIESIWFFPWEVWGAEIYIPTVPGIIVGTDFWSSVG